MELALTTRPARRVEGEIRAPATLVDATFHAIADAGSIPAVSTHPPRGETCRMRGETMRIRPEGMRTKER